MEAGCDPERFWTLTPIEAAREMRAKLSLRRNEQQRLAWLAWHIEALARTKKMPSLADMIGERDPNSVTPQDPETLLANLKLAFGFPGDPPQ
jgi:hypothetical protein